jgi:hypothetical protein
LLVPPRQRSREKTRQDPEALKRSFHNDVSGKDTRGCSDAAFMHALLKQQSHTDAR